jgi:2-oxoglutarate ferredoxin oxidoreductase subunit beta
VFNDGVFDDVLAKEQRPDMLVPLVHGEPIRFGANDDKGVVMGSDGQLRIVQVDDVGVDALLVHDAHRDDPGLAFALAHLSANVHSPTPFGVFRQVERPEYATEAGRQLLRAAEQKGSGDLGSLLRSNGTWTVG